VIDVGVETGAKRRSFAQALSWPGWCRGGRREDDALAALAAYAMRYGAVLGSLGADLDLHPGVAVGLHVAERVTGDATTEFGAPSRPFVTDTGPVTRDRVAWLAGVMDACWAAFDRAWERVPTAEREAKPEVGRAPASIRLHVAGAERAYLAPFLKVLREAGAPGADGLTTMGLPTSPGDADVEPIRLGFRAAVLTIPAGVAFAGPWEGSHRPPPYWVRRAAWHVLDHAWELEDRLGR
jgi:hypothetical protein